MARIHFCYRINKNLRSGGVRYLEYRLSMENKLCFQLNNSFAQPAIVLVLLQLANKISTMSKV